MAESRGIDIKLASDTSLVFTAGPKDSSDGSKITSGTMSLRLFHIVPATGALEQYDFDDNTFKAAALTTATASMTHRATDNSTYNTGMWTYRLATLTGFTSGDQYLAQISHTSAVDQERQFQYGGVEGEAAVAGDAMDLIGDAVDAAALKADAVTEIQSGLSTSVEVRRNADLIAHLAAHEWSGDYYYVDPVNGDDGTGDGSFATPWATVGKAQTDGVTTYNHDVVFLLAGDPNSRTILDEQLTITKAEWTIVGPGRDFLWTYTSNGDVLTITAAGVHLSNFAISTHSTGSGDAIVASQGADDLHIDRLFVEYARENGIEVTSCDWVVIDDCDFASVGANAASAAIHIDDGVGGSMWTHIQSNRIYESVGDGIDLTGSGVEHAIIRGNVIHGSSAYGISIGSNVSDTVIYDNHLSQNVSGDINDAGDDTVSENNEQWAKDSAYTAARAAYIDELAAANLPTDVDTLLTRLTAARAGYLDELDSGNIPADVDTLLSRLTAARAGYIDELNIGAEALAHTGNAASFMANLTTLETRLSAARAGYLDELSSGNIPADVDSLLSRLTAARAGYIDELNIGAETLAHTGNAASFMADVSALATSAALAVVAAYVDELETRLTAARAGYIDELAAANVPADIDTLLARLTAVRAGYLDAAVTSRSSHSAADVWTATTRTLTSIGAGAIAAVWNALTSGLSTVGSIGKLLVDNVDATVGSRSSHTAANVDTTLTAAHGAGSWQASGGGSGASTVTLTVQDGVSAPVSGVVVYISADGGSTWTYSATTGATGEAVFHLDDATYKAQCVKSGYTHTAENVVVSGTTTQTLTIAAFSAGDPPSPDMCRVSGRLAEIEGAAAISGRTIKCELADEAEGTIYFYDDENSQATTDASGDWYLDLVWSAVMGDARVRVFSVNAAGNPDGAIDKTILVPSESTKVLTAITAAT